MTRIEELARMSLAVRDLANTPLQTLELTLELLRRSDADPTIVERLSRSLQRLRRLNELLASYEQDVVWTARQESFDAVRVLERREAEPVVPA
jgi:hypothetical protein